MNMEKPDLIPENQSGTQTNTESSKLLDGKEKATAFYQIAKRRLLNVNQWHDLAGVATASFRLTDEKGNEVNRAAQKGDHFKIDIPGPGPVTGEGFDWVKIESIEEFENGDEEFTAIKVRPATNPLNERKDVAHFFSEEATSSFIVKLEDNKVIAGVYGRNEKANTASETVIDKARNTAVATGAITGFSKLQWKSLVNGLLKD